MIMQKTGKGFNDCSSNNRKCSTIDCHFPEERRLLEVNPNKYNPLETGNFYYHYTSIVALKSILSGKNIRLTYYKHLNDTEEGTLAFNLLLEQDIDSKKKEALKKLHEIAIKNFYIGSFSGFGNRLSLWRGYGNICIGFNPDRFNRNGIRFVKDKNGEHHLTSGLQFITCNYIDLEPKNIESRTKQLLENFRGLTFGSLNNIEEFQYYSLKLGLLLFAEKHIGFYEEREARIIYYLYDVKPFICEKGKKYIEYLFDPEAVERIVIGPSNRQREVFEEVSRILNKHGKDYEHVELFCSTIPYTDSNND